MNVYKYVKMDRLYYERLNRFRLTGLTGITYKDANKQRRSNDISLPIKTQRTTLDIYLYLETFNDLYAYNFQLIVF